MSGFQGEQPVVLKLSLDKRLKQEAATLKALAGFGAVKLLAECDGALLLERAVPGKSLRSYFPKREEESIRVACNVMKKLHQAPLNVEALPTINDWLKVLDKDWNIPANYMQKARKLRDRLLATSGEPVLLHGDLHHDNILQNETTRLVSESGSVSETPAQEINSVVNLPFPHLVCFKGNLRHESALQKQIGWLAIDPKGVVGEPAYEVAAFIRNPIPELLDNESACEIIMNRIETFAKILQLDAERIQNWCFVQAVLSWAWTLEDNIDSKYFERITKIFNTDYC